MTQDERWLTKYNDVIAFIDSNHRNPSRHRIEEHDMLNWLKANRKTLNAGKMKPERLDVYDEYKYVQQFPSGEIGAFPPSLGRRNPFGDQSGGSD